MADINIQHLPTIGQAESVKTKKQGRKVDMKHYHKEVLYTDKGFKRRIPLANINLIKVLCLRIIRFEKSSTKQREFARMVLSTIETYGTCDSRFNIKIQSINKTLCLEYKRAYNN